ALPGGMGVVWPPVVARDIPNATALEDALVAEARSWLCRHGSRMAQSLLAADEKLLAEPLLRNGFTHPTRLWYLRHDLELTAELAANPERLTLESYGECERDQFHDVLLRSYAGTCDFPELNERRSLDDVLLSLKASGCDAERWWLARDRSGPVGVLVTA